MHYSYKEEEKGERGEREGKARKRRGPARVTVYIESVHNADALVVK